MLEFNIRYIDDIYALKDVSENFDKIIIHTSHLKYLGVLRHAFKYAFWALKKNGILVVKDEPNCGYGFRKSKIQFWQVRNELFRVLKDEIEVLVNDLDLGEIHSKKINNHVVPSGISFCFVFSGQLNEIELLENSMKIISKFPNVEILVCGPIENKNSLIFSKYGVRYIGCDLIEKNRILYTKKKNILFEESFFDIVIIAHARILVTESFIKGISLKQFDVITPRVLFKGEFKTHRYLDYLLIPTYNLTNKTKSSATGLDAVDSNYLFLLKNMVPYIDGGMVVFNKKRIKDIPFSNYLGWGEAEDVEMSEFLYQKGYLIDFAFDLNCYTQTNKLDFESNKLQRIFRRIKRLNKRFS